MTDIDCCSGHCNTVHNLCEDALCKAENEPCNADTDCCSDAYPMACDQPIPHHPDMFCTRAAARIQKARLVARGYKTSPPSSLLQNLSTSLQVEAVPLDVDFSASSNDDVDFNDIVQAS